MSIPEPKAHVERRSNQHLGAVVYVVGTTHLPNHLCKINYRYICTGIVYNARDLMSQSTCSLTSYLSEFRIADQLLVYVDTCGSLQLSKFLTSVDHLHDHYIGIH